MECCIFSLERSRAIKNYLLTSLSVFTLLPYFMMGGDPFCPGPVPYGLSSAASDIPRDRLSAPSLGSTQMVSVVPTLFFPVGTEVCLTLLHGYVSSSLTSCPQLTATLNLPTLPSFLAELKWIPHSNRLCHQNLSQQRYGWLLSAHSLSHWPLCHIWHCWAELLKAVSPCLCGALVLFLLL